jgi:hypothetical protein
MPAAAPLCAQFTDQERTVRQQARAGARRTLPNPAATARALALAICEIEVGLRSASQLERICHPSLWEAVATASSGPGAQPSVAPVFCGSRPRGSRRAWSMPWRWSAVGSERCSWHCGWKPCRATGNSSSSSTSPVAGGPAR